MKSDDRFEADITVEAAVLRAVVRLPDRRAIPILPADLPDEEAVGRWLAAKATARPVITTLARYSTEAERLFWYARQVNTPISAWGLDEFSAYIGFQQAPAP